MSADQMVISPETIAQVNQEAQEFLSGQITGWQKIELFLRWLEWWYETENATTPPDFNEALQTKNLGRAKDLLANCRDKERAGGMARALLNANPEDALWIIDALPPFLQAHFYWLRGAINIKKERDPDKFIRYQQEEREWFLETLRASARELFPQIKSE